jgi:TolB-like protein
MSPTRSHTGQAPDVPAAERLESWKEIAAYLQRDESTLRRWAVRKGLPIHRQRVKSKITIYALKSEIDAWRIRRGDELEGVVTMTTTISTKPIETAPEQVEEEPPAPPVQVRSVPVERVAPSALARRLVRDAGGRPKWVAIPVVLAFIAATVLAVGYTTWDKSGDRPLKARIDSLAVLPLKDISTDATDEYLADGLTELLTSDLAEIKRLRVIAPASMMPYKTVRRPLEQMAEDLNVDAVVEGYVLRSRDRVRITLHLIEAKSATLIWTNTYERESKDVLALSRQFAQIIASELTPQRELPVVDISPIAAEVPEAYLRGNHYLRQLSCEGISMALTEFQQAAAGAPNFALAHARLASTYIKLADFGCVDPRFVVARARASAVRALNLDPNLGEAHAVLGVVSYLYDWDWWSAQSEFKRATELNPNDAIAHAWYGAFLFSLGKQAEALVQFSKARNIDPLPGAATLVYGYTLYHYRWYDRAIEQFQRVADLYPDSAPAYFGMAASYERKRMRGKALKNYLKARELSGTPTQTLAVLRNAGRSGGLTGFWQKELQLAAAQPDPCRSSLSAAHIGATTQMLGLLERAYDARCSTLASLKVDPLYDRLRKEPRFVRILKLMGLPNADPVGHKPANARTGEKPSERTA